MKEFFKRFRYPKAWIALFAIVALVLTNYFDLDIPQDWDIVVDLFLGVLIAIGVIGDPTKPFTWADFWAGFHSPVTKTALWTLVVYVLTNWIFVWLAIDAKLIEIFMAIFAFVAESYGVKNNPLTPNAP